MTSPMVVAKNGRVVKHKRCESSECDEVPVGTIVYQRSIDDGEFVEWAADQLCEYHGRQHMKHCGNGAIVPFGTTRGLSVRQRGVWIPK